MASSGTPQDAIVIGAGIVGAAVAFALAQLGLRVVVIEASTPAGGATAAGMGHLCVIDDSPAQLALTGYSLSLWQNLAAALPREAEYHRAGTIWVAADEDELRAAREKVAILAAAGVRAEMLDEAQLRLAEPNLRPGLPGGLLMPDDAIVYAPPVVRWLLSQVREKGGQVLSGAKVVGIDSKVVLLADHRALPADLIVVATGIWAPELFPGLPVRPRKGHLAITDRYPGFCYHQIVELAYIKNAHGHSDESVSFNIQPRTTGQLLIGSSRQFNAADPAVEPRMLRKVLARAAQLMPGVANMNVLRAWTGFRAATPDSLPIIGQHPARPGVYFATGHEGLGLTTSLATAALLASRVSGEPTPLDASLYAPDRPTLLEPSNHA
jgi:glycine/D-amino acid oxidase-like deaminating enzyme